MENNIITTEKLVSEMDNKIGLLGIKIDSLNRVKSAIGLISQDAEEKIHKGMQKYFLWDNNDLLQMIDDLMYRLMEEVNEEYRQAHEIQSQLYQLVRGGEEAMENQNVAHHSE